VGTCSTYILAPLFISTLFTSEHLTSSPTHLYLKDERVLPGDLHSHKFSSVSSCEMLCETLPTPTFSSLSFWLQSVKTLARNTCTHNEKECRNFQQLKTRILTSKHLITEISNYKHRPGCRQSITLALDQGFPKCLIQASLYY
jgi:hypothetical protein